MPADHTRAIRHPASNHAQRMTAAPQTADDLGSRLARLRQMYGMSQRELARLSGMTNGTISLIEKNLTSPQVASLKKILTVFSMNMATFFAMELEESDQVFFSKRELIEIGGAGISLRLVAGQKRSNGASSTGSFRKAQLCKPPAPLPARCLQTPIRASSPSPRDC